MIRKRRDIQIDWTSVSAVSSNSTDAAIKLLTSLVMSYEFHYDSVMKRKINAWYKDSLPFFKRFKIRTKDLTVATKGLVAGKDPDDDTVTHEAIVETMYLLNDAKKDITKELDVSKLQLSMLNDIRLYMLKESQAALKRISANIGNLSDPDLNKMFVHDVEDTTDTQQSLENLIKKHTGKSGLVMPFDKLDEWQNYARDKGQKRADHTKYLELRKVLNTEFKKFLVTTVRSSDKQRMLVQDLIRLCDDNSVPHNLPEGFVGYIDDQGKYYTLKGLKLKSAPSGDVRMNPNYNAKEDNAYVCEFKAFGGKDYSRAYTENYSKQAKQKNFRVISDTVPKIKSISSKWLADVSRVPRTRESVLGAVVEFMYETGARVGGKNAESKGAKTYGTTQLLVKHVIKLDNAGVHIRYHGKSAGVQNHILKFNTPRLKKLGKAIKALRAKKKPDDLLFSHQGKPFTSAMVKRYMTSLGFPKEWSAKKLRTAKGTVMFSEAIKKSPFKKKGNWNESDIHKWLESQALDVGAQLGHSSGDKVTPNTAIQNYIDPSIIAKFYADLGVRPSAKFQKAIDSIA